MYLGRWEIDDYLTFAAQTHDSTGAAADADAVPSYAIYEDETAAALVTGNMAKLGAVTGFYTERVQLTAAAGFEVSKAYTVRVQATVGGVVAAKADQFCLGGVTIRGGKNTLDSLNDITVADIIAGISEGTLDLQEMLRIILAAVAGKASGGGTTSIKFRDQADTLDRITATVDANGNRTAVTVDGS